MIQRRGAQKYPDTVWGKGNPPKVGRKNLSAWACAEEAQDCFSGRHPGKRRCSCWAKDKDNRWRLPPPAGRGPGAFCSGTFSLPEYSARGSGNRSGGIEHGIWIAERHQNGEYRTIATPAEIATIVADGHTALVQRGAGEKAGFEDQEYEKAGARLVDTMEDIYGQADFVTKVKELEPCEFPLLRKGQIIFTCIHPAAHPPGGPGHPWTAAASPSLRRTATGTAPQL